MSTSPSPSPPRRAALAGPILMACAMVIVLAGLGVWQIQRGQEKKELIAALDLRLGQTPIALPAADGWPQWTRRSDEFRRVFFTATFLPTDPVLVFTSASPLRSDVAEPGYWVFAPARLESGDIVVVNRGFVTERHKGDAQAGLPEDRTISLTGYLRFDERPGWFTPAPDVPARQFYARQSAEMAQAQGWGLIAPFYIDMEGPAPDGPGPKPGALVPRLPDNHFQYALTWFALAIIVLVLSGVWLRGQRRRAR